MAESADTVGYQSARPSTSSSFHHGGLPASPTLTNPDMILPDYDEPDSPISQQRRSQSPLTMWKNAQVSDMAFQIHSRNDFVAGPVTPTTPIIYGNGTMLSDIGEVTEVESNAGVDDVKRVSVRKIQNPALRSSPTMGYEAHRLSKDSSRTHRASIDSTSTITDHDHLNRFADFDDSVSVDDTHFHGDDEESMASSYKDDAQPRNKPRDEALKTLNGITDEDYGTNSISQRAEEILANAKRRLTKMEGNLSRARSSLSNSSMSDGSTPSPSTQRRPATAMKESTTFGSSHSRTTSSENSSSGPPKGTQLQRSASALGAAGGYRQPLSSRQSNGDKIIKGPTYKVTQPTLTTTIEAPDENMDGEDVSAYNTSGRRGSATSASFVDPSPTPSGTYLDAGMPRAASVAQVRDLQDQMNGLKGKISSLREQAMADSMKRRSLQSLRTPSPFTHARFENGLMEPRDIKRAEANSPIATEPIQAPETLPNETEAIDHQPPDGLHSESGGEVQMPTKILEDMSNEEDEKAEDNEPWEPICPDRVGEESVAEEFGQSVGKLPNSDTFGYGSQAQAGAFGEVEDDFDETPTEHNDYGREEYPLRHDEEGQEGDDGSSDAGDSIYHDTNQGLSHEDREDAFDYENFFLHSAMGTLSRQGQERRGSWGSYDSESSVETTRGPTDPTDLTDLRDVRERRPSVDTISTVNTFATAMEGRASRSSVAPRTDTRQSNVQPVQELDEEFEEPEQEEARDNFGMDSVGMMNWHAHRQQASTISHRPSISSFESTGTTRSFPLVNKPKGTASQLTPDGTPDSELKRLSRSLIGETVSMLDKQEAEGSAKSEAVQALSRHDQASVQMLLASLGHCVLGLGEAPQNGAGLNVYRNRIEQARRILEGLEE